MVVENVPGVWRFGLLRPHLRRLLLCQQGKVLVLLGGSGGPKLNSPFSCLLAPAGYRRVRPLAALLRLHRPDGADLLAADGHDRLLRRLHVYQENLRRGKNRLMLFLNLIL